MKTTPKKKATAKKTAASAIEDVFGSAPATAAAKKTTTTKYVPEMEMKEGFETLVALIMVEKALKGIKGQLEGQYKEDAYDHFITGIKANGQKPASVVGIDGDASALFQFKKRSAGFSDDVASDLEANGISFEKEEVVPERFVINPEVVGDQNKLGQLAQAIQKLDLDFQVIIKQEPTFKNQTNDSTIRELSQVKDNEIQAKLIKAISSLAISQAKIGGCDVKGGALESALAILKENGILG